MLYCICFSVCALVMIMSGDVISPSQIVSWHPSHGSSQLWVAHSITAAYHLMTPLFWNQWMYSASWLYRAGKKAFKISNSDYDARWTKFKKSNWFIHIAYINILIRGKASILVPPEACDILLSSPSPSPNPWSQQSPSPDPKVLTKSDESKNPNLWTRH